MKKVTLMVVSIAMIFAGCKKDKNDDATPANNNLTVNSTPQVIFKLDGTETSVVTSALIDQSVGSSGQLTTPPDSSSSSWSSSFGVMTTGDEIFSIDKGYMRFLGSTPDTAAYTNFFKPGSYTYVNNCDVQMGVRMQYFINGVKWSTEQGTGNQTGSTFTIVDRKTWNILGQTGVVIIANFNCKIYDGLGNSKTITDGTVVSSFENF